MFSAKTLALAMATVATAQHMNMHIAARNNGTGATTDLAEGTGLSTNTPGASTNLAEGTGLSTNTPGASTNLAEGTGLGTNTPGASTNLAEGTGLGTNTAGAVITTTRVVDTFITYCPGPTSFAFNGHTYEVTEACTLTITDCPCTIVEPCHTCVGVPPAQPTGPGKSFVPVNPVVPGATGAPVPPYNAPGSPGGSPAGPGSPGGAPGSPAGSAPPAAAPPATPGAPGPQPTGNNVVVSGAVESSHSRFGLLFAAGAAVMGYLAL